jgi:hypothetical protein
VLEDGLVVLAVGGEGEAGELGRVVEPARQEVRGDADQPLLGQHVRHRQRGAKQLHRGEQLDLHVDPALAVEHRVQPLQPLDTRHQRSEAARRERAHGERVAALPVHAQLLPDQRRRDEGRARVDQQRRGGRLLAQREQGQPRVGGAGRAHHAARLEPRRPLGQRRVGRSVARAQYDRRDRRAAQALDCGRKQRRVRAEARAQHRLLAGEARAGVDHHDEAGVAHSRSSKRHSRSA